MSSREGRTGFRHGSVDSQTGTAAGFASTARIETAACSNLTCSMAVSAARTSAAIGRGTGELSSSHQCRARPASTPSVISTSLSSEVLLVAVVFAAGLAGCTVNCA